ncbi:MAG: lysophospholipid acyltransferase family protein [Candidatus Poribacteria bacterium]|nr:lysophospholipid acyltransferase family protein [Candidatus Poribacteria bacterium]MDE0506894.1 lysophospholipid acyltransferase family protein [Candidatus Poribacteria bacterium]
MKYQHFSFWTDSVPYRWSQRCLGAAFTGLCNLEAHGNEHVPRKGGVLLLSNHVSYLDPFIVGTTARREFYFMTRDNMFGIPLLGKLLALHNAYPVKRGTADRSALRRTISLLKDGHAVLIFPEGTRSKDGNLGKARDGVSFIIHNADVPAIPVYLAGANCLMPRRSKWVRPAKLSTHFGPPIDFSEARETEDKRLMYQRMSRMIMESIGALGGLAHAAR